MPDTNAFVDPTLDFDALYAAHRDDVWRYLRRRTTDPATSEDLATEVFVTAWRRRAELPADPLPWLYGVARRVLANDRRAAGRRDALAERVGGHTGGHTADHAEAVAARDAIAGALGALSASDRELVLLVAWEGLSLEEAARALGCRRGTAAVRLHRARRRLRTALVAEPGGPALSSLTALEHQ